MKTQTIVERRLLKARTTLLLDHPFFGSLLFRLKGRESRSIKTMATDGISLFYNPDFVDTLSAATLCGVLAHEVLHPGLQHHVRRSVRDPKRWNEACDYAINPILLDAGLHLPEGALVNHRFREKSAEQIYNQLQTEAAKEAGDQIDALEAGGEGIASSHTSPGASGELSVPAGIERTLEGAAEAAVDWRELLRKAWSETTSADYSWMRPNQRYIWTGLYLPGVVREGVGEIAIAVDCSGSVN
jgi:predicted metal-dependent peptidase